MQCTFDRATFTDVADFSDTTFSGSAFFDGATFLGPADFSNSTFGEHADFDKAVFAQDANFTHTTFDDHAGFQDTHFKSYSVFSAAKFRSYVDLENATFDEDAIFWGTTFQLARQLGPFVTHRNLIFDESLFVENVTIEAFSTGLLTGSKTTSGRATIFAGGVRLALRGCEIMLEYADFGRASTLLYATTWATPEKKDWTDDLRLGTHSQPYLLSLRGAKVAHLSISNINLCDCRFLGAHGLEAIKIESSCNWPHTPRILRCGDRETIAEEHHYRYRKEAEEERLGWHKFRRFFIVHWSKHNSNPVKPPDDIDAPVDPEQIATLYRALREAREDNKDQAGASDLYYGEMEMRRRAPPPERGGWGLVRWGCDKIVLFLYWLLAGYGLKASRAFFSFAVLILLAAIPLTNYCLEHPRYYIDAIFYALRTSASLLHAPDGHPSRPEVIAEIVVKITGPLLFGLGLLSLRSRIKR